MGEAIISRRGGGEYGNATDDKVLAPHTIGTEDGVVPGTMPDRAGDTAALAISRSGTTIKLRASKGYRDGVDDNVTHADPNDIAANIKQGVTIRGLMGTLVPLTNEKKWVIRTDITGATISGLTFAPALIVFMGLNANSSKVIGFATKDGTKKEIYHANDSGIYNDNTVEFGSNSITIGYTSYSYMKITSITWCYITE